MCNIPRPLFDKPLHPEHVIGVVVLAVFITDRKGDILFQHVDPNFKVRLDNGVILAAARSFK